MIGQGFAAGTGTGLLLSAGLVMLAAFLVGVAVGWWVYGCPC